jgi:hypothetical protein
MEFIRLCFATSDSDDDVLWLGRCRDRLHRCAHGVRRDANMLGWFQALMPREERFFQLFDKHATIVVAGAEALRGSLRSGDNIEACCNEIFQREAEADEVTDKCWSPSAAPSSLRSTAPIFKTSSRQWTMPSTR